MDLFNKKKEEMKNREGAQKMGAWSESTLEVTGWNGTRNKKGRGRGAIKVQRGRGGSKCRTKKASFQPSILAKGTVGRTTNKEVCAEKDCERKVEREVPVRNPKGSLRGLYWEVECGKGSEFRKKRALKRLFTKSIKVRKKGDRRG